MIARSRDLLCKCTVIAAIAVLWVLSYRLNGFLFAAWEHSVRANWVFLPAAIRLLAVLLYGRLAALGLVLGSFIVGYGSVSESLSDEICVAISSGLAPWVAVCLGKRWLSISETLAGLRPLHIALLSVTCAVFNGLFLNTYLALTHRLHGDFGQIVTMIVGDVLGAAIVLFVLSVLLSFALPKSRSRLSA